MANYLPPHFLHVYGARAVVRGELFRFGLPIRLGGQPVLFMRDAVALQPVPIIADGAVVADASCVKLEAVGAALAFEVEIGDDTAGAKLVEAVAREYRATPVYAAIRRRVDEVAGQLCEIVEKAQLVAISLDAGRKGGRLMMSSGGTTLRRDYSCGLFDGPSEVGHNR